MLKISKNLIFKNLSFYFFTLLIRLFSNFFIFIIIARLYGPIEFGQFTLAFTIANICLIIADFGFDILMSSEISRNREKAALILRDYIPIKVLISGFATGILILFSYLPFFSDGSKILMKYLVLYVIIVSLCNFVFSIFKGLERFQYETYYSILMNVIFILGICISLLFQLRINSLIIMLILSRIVILLLAIFKLKTILNISINVYRPFVVSRNFNKVITFGIYFLFGNLFFQIDTIFLGIFKDDEVVGIYQSAFKMLLLLLLLPDLLRNSVLPFFSRIHNENKEKWVSYSKIILDIFVIIGLILCLSVNLFAREIIHIFYGLDVFYNAIKLLKYFTFIALIRYFSEPFIIFMITSNKEKSLALLVIITTIISIIVNYYSTKYFSMNIVAILMIFVNLFFLIGCIMIVLRDYPNFISSRGRKIFLLVTSVIFLFLNEYLIANNVFKIISLLVLVTVSYFYGMNKYSRILIKEFFKKNELIKNDN